jgi:hypothetical protein
MRRLFTVRRAACSPWSAARANATVQEFHVNPHRHRGLRAQYSTVPRKCIRDAPGTAENRRCDVITLTPPRMRPDTNVSDNLTCERMELRVQFKFH